MINEVSTTISSPKEVNRFGKMGIYMPNLKWTPQPRYRVTCVVSRGYSPFYMLKKIFRDFWRTYGINIK